MAEAPPRREGFHRHWFIDGGDRIAIALASGWTHVLDGGEPTKKVVEEEGTDRSWTFFLMEIEIARWTEFQRQRHESAESRRRA